MKIVFFEANKEDKEFLSKHLKSHKLSFYDKPIDNYETRNFKDYEIVSVETGSTMNKKELEQLSSLKMVAARCTGYDKIDLEYCKEKGIAVSNVPAYAQTSVAEHTFALILALSRNITKSYNRVHKNNFSIEGLQGFDLSGKTLGVIGTGRIGSNVIRIAKGFGMKVIAFNKTIDKKMGEELGFKFVKLEELLKNSDIITIHTPLTPETEHLINEKTINKMKSGVVIINTARGKIIDTKALVKAIDKGKIAGAGLDVLEGEEMMKNKEAHKHLDLKSFKQLAMDHKLLNRENVIFTPHIAFSSDVSKKNLLEETINNILSFTNKKVKNSVIN